jgi:hypothetical protein
MFYMYELAQYNLLSVVEQQSGPHFTQQTIIKLLST